MFIFYVGNLLNWFLSSRSIIGRFLVFSIQAVIPSTDKNSFISSFLICFTCIFFSSLTALARNPSIMLNKSVENRYLRRKEKTFTLSPSNMMLAIVLLFFFCRCFSTSWNLYFYFLFFRYFIMNRHWILLNGFSASIDKILWFFFFSLVI